MANPKNTSQNTYQSLQNQYEQLSDLEKMIVGLLAIFYTPVPRNDLAIALNRLGQRDVKNNLWSASSLKLILDKLITQNFIDAEPRKGISCPVLLREI
ncbi:MAG: hypothetical protein ACKN9E_05050, partial [Microcystaceae cyanobacterium]